MTRPRAMHAIDDDGDLAETVACIREQREIVSFACSTLAGSLRTGAISEALQSVERICATVLMVDVLMSFLARTGAPRAALEEANRERECMLRESSIWLAAAVRDLPGADVLARRFLCASQEQRDRAGGWRS
jgi:hypothetical protein